MNNIKRFSTLNDLGVVKADDAELQNVVLDADGVPEEIEILQPGAWDTPGHGEFEVTNNDLEQYVSNFNAGVRKGVPIDLEHKTDGGAVGWVKELAVKAGSLWGKVEWNTQGKTLLQDKAYKYFSPEFAPKGYKDPEGKGEFDNVLIGGALTNRPLFKALKPVVANDEGGKPDSQKTISSLTSSSGKHIIYAEEEASVNIEDVRKKSPADLTEDEKNFLVEHKSELSDTEVQTFGLQDQPVEGGKEGEAIVEPAKPAETPAEPVAADDKTKGGVVISADEHAALVRMANEGAEARRMLAQKEASDKVDEHVKRGAIKASQAEQAIDFLMASDSKSVKKFEEFLKELPSNDLVTAGEMGDSAAIDAKKADSLDAKAQEIMAADKTIEYSVALKMAASQEPHLAKTYDKE